MEQIKPLKKIVIFCFNRSGVYQYSTQLANTLAKSREWEVLFITSVFNDRTLIEEGIVKTIYLKAPHTAFKFLHESFKQFFLNKILWKKIDFFAPELIHVTDAYPWYLFWNKNLRKRPLVLTIHDPIAHRGEKLGYILEYMVKYLLKISSHVIVLGTTLKITLEEKLGVKQPITVIPHGNFDFYKKTASGRPVKKNSLLFFGRIVSYKGVQVLISAFQKLIDDGLDLLLVIAGEGEIGKYQRKIREKDLSKIEFINNYIPDQKVAELFEECAVVVLPYLEATQSGVVPIALSFGKPPIVTNVGSLTDVIKDGVNGLVVPANDVRALAGAIKNLLSDAVLYQKLHQEALVTSEQLAWEKIGPRYGEVYKKVIR